MSREMGREILPEPGGSSPQPLLRRRGGGGGGINQFRPVPPCGKDESLLVLTIVTAPLVGACLLRYILYCTVLLFLQGH